MALADVIDHPDRAKMETIMANARASRCGLPLTLQEMSLEETMYAVERGLAFLEQNAAGLRKLPHLDAAKQLSQWSRRTFRLSFDI